VNQQPISSTDSLCLPITEEPASTPDSRERLILTVVTAALYGVLAWIAWPGLAFRATGVGDEAWMEALRQQSLIDALTYVGGSWWRPGESLMLWGMAHSGSLVPWRLALLAIMLLTTACMQYDCTVRGKSQLDGFAAALTFGLNPTTLSVLCWLAVANISVCTVGILAYVAFARRALETESSPVRDAVFATLALAFALAFYELAMFAPLVAVGYQYLLAPQAQRQAKLWLYAGSGLCVLGYLVLQAQLGQLPRLVADAPVLALFASSMRYVVLNFYLWFNPFETFGVLIPDPMADHTLENIMGFVLVGIGLGLSWLARKRDPLTTLSGLWFLIFLVPVGLLHFDGTPIAEHHLYIPMLGVALGAVRQLTRFLEWAIVSIRNKPLRVAFEVTLSAVLLWSLAPLVAECKRTVAHFSDARELYLTTLQNYPNSLGALDGLTRVFATDTTHLTPSDDEAAPAWKQLVDAFLLSPKPRPASELLVEGQALLHDARYEDAGSALARAFATSSTPQEQLDSGKGLVQALWHTKLHDRAAALLQRLRHDHPAEIAGLVLD
jgi:hypothetical protein